MSIVRNLDSTSETKHPFLENIGMKTLYSKEKDGAEVTCFFVRCRVGSEIEEHAHPEEVDIIFEVSKMNGVQKRRILHFSAGLAELVAF